MKTSYAKKNTLEPKSHIFDVKIAEQYGVNAAIMIQTLQFWIHKNKANKSTTHFREGRWWTYNSIDAFTKIFPYWNARQVRHILDTLEKQGVIVKARFGGQDRRTWYAFGPKNPFDKYVNSTDGNCQMDLTKSDPSTDKYVKCIKGAVDKPVELPVKGKISQKELSGPAHSKAALQDACRRLKRVGVDPNVAERIVYEQNANPADIRQAINNAIAKEFEAGQADLPWQMEPGYVIESLNTAAREGHRIAPSAAFKRMERTRKSTLRPSHRMTARERERSKQKQMAALGLRNAN